MQEEDVTRFVFVDETSTNLTYCRYYGRAPAGQRLDQAVPLHSGPNVTLIAALTPDGLGALLSVNGAVNGDVFAAYLDQVLGPTLRPGDVVVLDNLSVHKVGGLDDIVKKYGARLRYLPPYSRQNRPKSVSGGRHGYAICPLIRLILTRLNWLLANSRRGCAPPRPAPATCWKRPL